ncbi:hypothetical protein SpCBS45565_g08373 [Spizellomyces sp. 'palustris']|nr:hypothetical protein SpCBS45565_g08373 [Spizellomyces sp. 'palustris']
MSLSHQTNAHVFASAEFQSLKDASPALSLQGILQRSGFVSGNKWDHDYFDALKVHVVLDEAPENLDMHSTLFKYSGSDLVSDDFEMKNVGDHSWYFYNVLRDVVEDWFVSSDDDIDSGLSAATDKQDTTWKVSDEMLRAFLSYWTIEEEPFVLRGRRLAFNVRAEQVKHGMQVCGRRIAVRTDGILSVFDQKHKAKKVPPAVFAFIEAKRHLDSSKTNEAIVAQIAAKVISVAQYNYNQSRRPHATPEARTSITHLCIIEFLISSSHWIVFWFHGARPEMFNSLWRILTKLLG